MTVVVSVVMPLYNKEHDVARAIGSALAQTFADFELIVVNDGSTDCSVEVVRGIIDPRIRLVEQTNAGVSAARNRGIAEARAELVAFLDADDEWLPEYLSTILHLDDKFPFASIFATSYRYMDKFGRERPIILNGLPPSAWEGILDNYFAIAACSDPPICSSAVAVKKVALERIGGFPVGVRSGEDLLTWARLAAHFKVAYSTTPQVVFCQWFDPDGKPTRKPTEVDEVGAGLEALLDVVPPERRPSLGHYIALWYRMRTSIYLRLGLLDQARRECVKMSRFAPRGDSKALVYKFLVNLPKPLQPLALSGLHKAKKMRAVLKNGGR